MQVGTNKAVKQWTWGVALAAVALGAPAYGADPEAIMDGLKGVSVKGYVEGQYNYNFNDPSTQANAFRVFDTKANSFTFNMAELALTKSSEAGTGFGLVLNYGLDAQVTSASGSTVNTDPTGAPSLDGSGNPITTKDDFDVQQAYVSEKLGGNVELKLGKFATLAGAEVIEGPANYNISRSFLFGWAIPFTHTGLRAAYTTPVPGLAVTLGLNNGWDVVNDGDKGKTAELQVAMTPMDMLAVAVTGYYGPESTAVDNDNRGVVDVVATIKPMDGLAVVLNYDRGSQETFNVAGDSALWQGYAVYANLGIGDKHAVTLRGEVFDDQDGFRTSAVQTLREVTLTFACKMKENLEWRAEYRYDQSNLDTAFVDDKGNPEDSQSTIAVAAYYTF
jgi:hypothetical protein